MAANYKKLIAEKAMEYIQPNQRIGLGDGSTILFLADLIGTNQELIQTLQFSTSSHRTEARLTALGIVVHPLSAIDTLDIYFDGCDQFDADLNAFKSGSGIHTTEKIFAAMAAEFILLADSSKQVEKLNTAYPLVVEVSPAALATVTSQLQHLFPSTNMKVRSIDQSEKPDITANGNYLLELSFTDPLPDLERLNTQVKMLPGLLNHSLFYKMANKAIVAGEQGVTVLQPQ